MLRDMNNAMTYRTFKILLVAEGGWAKHVEVVAISEEAALADVAQAYTGVTVAQIGTVS